MNDNLDKSIHNAIKDDIEKIPFNSSDKIWSRIENALEELEPKKKPSFFFTKIAVVIFLVFTSGILLVTPRFADSFPFGSFFRNLFDQYLAGTQRNVGLTPPFDAPPSHKPIMLDPTDAVVINPVQEEFIETTLEELASIYPNILYLPQETFSSRLNKAMYQKLGEDNIRVVLAYEGGAINFSLTQETVSNSSGVGINYDNQDAEVHFVYENGIEYMFFLGRYNIITAYWFQHGYKFTFFGNLTIDQAMPVIRSISRYVP
ncbi:MAG: DUF4367 domain-containing protein [Dethiobacter sp.]|jgi:hypothetical protein|nr:DUF4367 domain-containing protein [Dethiobacter sp.]MBS3989987.1 DUF4367 domain-containing protein [Dethiobacter sp.]